MLHVDDSAPTAVLSLAHGKVNALDVELLEAVADRLAALATSQCTALVVTGRGRVFSAGVDLFRVLEGGEDYVDRLIPALGRAVQAVFEFPKPVIAAVNGPAIAGGYTIAAACNRCIVADDAPIGASEVRVGVPMPVPVLEVLRYACGDRAEAVTLSGQLFRGADAVAHRLADEVASRDWCKNRLTRFLSIILRGGCNSLVDHLLIVLSVIGRDQLVPQVL